ncbi:hypothetical protein PGB90_001293 [Kerria lacca]
MKNDEHLDDIKVEEAQQLLYAVSYSKGDANLQNRISLNTVFELNKTPAFTEINSQRRESSTSIPETFTHTTLDPRFLLHERYSLWDNCYLGKDQRKAGTTFQGQVYNFLERPSGLKCLIYHFTVLLVLEFYILGDPILPVPRTFNYMEKKKKVEGI